MDMLYPNPIIIIIIYFLKYFLYFFIISVSVKLFDAVYFLQLR